MGIQLRPEILEEVKTFPNMDHSIVIIRGILFATLLQVCLQQTFNNFQYY